ncbi:DNA mismatch repair protein MutS, partial [bacterium CG17_big_fil_post_rev_8_21_14_2_50_64_8]
MSSIGRIQQERYVWLDKFTISNLELLHSQYDSGTPLIDILDKTVSPMGARLLKNWVVLPLTSLPEIKSRHDVVEFLLEYPELSAEAESYIRQMGDIQRLIARVPLGKISPREVVQLRKALEATDPLKVLLSASGNVFLEKMADGLNPCGTLQREIKRQLVENPPALISKGNAIAAGCNAELDDLRNVVHNSQELLIGIQKAEAARTGIDNLKIGFNNVFGYY